MTPWLRCAVCETHWQGWDPCWACGAAGDIAPEPRIKTYAVTVEPLPAPE